MLTGRFEYVGVPGRVVFAIGAVREIPSEIERLGCRRVLVIDGLIDHAVVADIAFELGDAHLDTVGEIRQHVPADLADSAREQAVAGRADCLLAVGGGSATGLAKAVALTTGLPIVAVPTTYAGSEMTPIWGVSAEGRKTTGRDATVLPRTVIYDPELTLADRGRHAGRQHAPRHRRQGDA